MANPTFQTISCISLNRENTYDLCIFVNYADKADDILQLKKSHEDTVFGGHLLKEKIRICVVIKDVSNPDDMEVKVISFILPVKLFVTQCISRPIDYNNINIHL